MRAKANSYFTIPFKTKPYLKKYLLSKYGNPLIFTTDNFFGVCISGLLQRPVRLHYKKENLRFRTDRFNDTMEITVPMRFLTNDTLGFEITDAHQISLNMLFGKIFEEELTFYCTVLNICGVETKAAMEDFCRFHNIEVEVDISYDALKKKEYRYRKFHENMSDNVSPENKKVIQQTLNFG